MHLVDRDVGFKGSTAIVGNTIPVGVGLGLALALQGVDRVAVIYLGEAAVEEGVFYESINFAVLRQLPVLFVCENNLYSVYSPLSVRQPEGRVIHAMVGAMGVRSSAIDGNSVEECYDFFSDEIQRIRHGGGPGFVECRTYRWREHCGPRFDNDLGYRTAAEFLEWKERDPIACHETILRHAGVVDHAAVRALDDDVAAEVDAAFESAESAPFPDARDGFAHVFCERTDT